MEGWKRYVQVHRSYPICRRGCSTAVGRATLVVLRYHCYVRLEGCLSSDPIVQSFQATSGTTILGGKNAGASSWTFPSISRWIFQSKIFIFAWMKEKNRTHLVLSHLLQRIKRGERMEIKVIFIVGGRGTQLWRRSYVAKRSRVLPRAYSFWRTWWRRGRGTSCFDTLLPRAAHVAARTSGLFIPTFPPLPATNPKEQRSCVANTS